MAQTQVAESDEGKRVVDQNGTEVGVVSGIRAGKVYVDPEPGVTAKIRSKLGWEPIEADHYVLDNSDIDAVDNGVIRLK